MVVAVVAVVGVVVTDIQGSGGGSIVDGWR